MKGSNTKMAVLAVLAAMLLAGCATTKTLQPTGGSKSDGTIDMSYEYGEFEKPQPQWADAQQKAEQRCEAWGYSDAEKFGGVMEQCQRPGGMGCARMMVTATYQCTD